MTARCDRCNEIHDESPAALAMCRAASALLDEEHREGTPRPVRRTLLAAYQHAYARWAQEAA